MTIHIDIKDEEGNVLFCSTSLSLEGAEAELGRFERHVLPTIKKEEVTDF